MFNKYLETVKTVILSPKKFFEQYQVSPGYKDSLIFLLINTTISILISSLFANLLLSFKPQQFFTSIPALIIILPLTIIVMFIVAGILHIIAKILGGKSQFAGSFQALSYASAVSPLTSIPFLGMVASIYQIYVIVIGFRKVHQYSTVKAVINILLPLVILIILLTIIIAIAGVAFLKFLGASGINPTDLKSLQNVYPTYAPNSQISPVQSDYPDNYNDANSQNFTD